jgi:Icc-related predicted phosphoesterase
MSFKALTRPLPPVKIKRKVFMQDCFFVSDLHGKIDRYEKLFKRIREDRPRLVLFGGDLLPHGMHRHPEDDFTQGFLRKNFLELKNELGDNYPLVAIILGNDDPGAEEESFLELEAEGLCRYLHMRKIPFAGFTIYGYSFIPPSPFRYKDWERYDVSRYVDPGCVPPDEGIRTIDPGCDIEYTTIQKELLDLTGEESLRRSVFLFHSPPYKTLLDRAALDGMRVEHVPLDVHVGSIAIMRMIEERQPWLTLHGHIHESTRLTGSWHQQFGATHSFNGAHDGPELALIVFDIEDPKGARRLLI